MTACSVILQRAYRQSNIIPIGTAPSTAQITEGLAVLNSGLNSVIGGGFFENLQDWPVPYVQRVGGVAANPPLYPGSAYREIALNNQYPAKNTRIVWDGSEQTVYLPENPPDGACMSLIKSVGNGKQSQGLLTVSGNGRTIEGQPDFLSTTDTTRNWFYRADLADWIQVLPVFATTDEMPFPNEYDDFWISSLTIQLSPMYGKTIQQATTATVTRTLQAMKARYFQPTDESRGGEDLPASFESFFTGQFNR